MKQIQSYSSYQREVEKGKNMGGELKGANYCVYK